MATTTFVPSGEQAEVIAHRGGHLQVVACAGAGKTEAIARRVAALIEEGVEPVHIVAFTFTERPGRPKPPRSWTRATSCRSSPATTTWA